jgi:hypothetical protein
MTIAVLIMSLEYPGASGFRGQPDSLADEG